jgi:hypothetical protein
MPWPGERCSHASTSNPIRMWFADTSQARAGSNTRRTRRCASTCGLGSRGPSAATDLHTPTLEIPSDSTTRACIPTHCRTPWDRRPPRPCVTSSLEEFCAGTAYRRGARRRLTRHKVRIRSQSHRCQGVITLADEVLTSDSSRYWDSEGLLGRRPESDSPELRPAADRARLVECELGQDRRPLRPSRHRSWSRPPPATGS